MDDKMIKLPISDQSAIAATGVVAHRGLQSLLMAWSSPQYKRACISGAQLLRMHLHGTSNSLVQLDLLFHSFIELRGAGAAESK